MSTTVIVTFQHKLAPVIKMKHRVTFHHPDPNVFGSGPKRTNMQMIHQASWDFFRSPWHKNHNIASVIIEKK